jgi:uncharacterized OB-fold protein
VDAEPTRSIPVVDEMTREFWTAGGRGELRITSCSDCGRLFHPPGPVCPFCWSRRIAHTTVSGAAVVDSFTIVRRPWISGYETPYVVGRVRLREQADVVLVTNIVGVELHQVEIGMEVEAIFERRGDVHVPTFRPAR